MKLEEIEKRKSGEDVKAVKEARVAYRNRLFECFCNIVKDEILKSKHMKDFNSLRVTMEASSQYNDEGYSNEFTDISVDEDSYELRDDIYDAFWDANKVLDRAFLNEIGERTTIEIFDGVYIVNEDGNVWRSE